MFLEMSHLAAEGTETSGGSSLIGTAQVVVGIAVALLGMPYTYFLISKTRTETELKELEIQEKRHSLGNLPQEEIETEVTGVELHIPQAQISPTLQALVVKFVLFEVFARIWFGASSLLVSTTVSIVPFFNNAIAIVPSVLFWFIAGPIAISIFADATRLLGVSVADFSWNPREHPIVTISVISILILATIGTTLLVILS